MNYWYDMQFDSRYAAYTLVESLARQAGLVPEVGVEDAEAEDSTCRSPCCSLVDCTFAYAIIENSASHSVDLPRQIGL